MRYATVVIAPGDQGIHPADAALVRESWVTREAVHQVNLLNDDTCVALYSLTGDLRRAAALLSDRPDVLACDVTGEREGFAYVHLEPNERLHRLLTIVQQNEIVLDTPIDCLAGGGVRCTLIGDGPIIHRAVDEIPDDLTLRLEGMGDYHHDTGQPYASLTGRQREVLETALELGYYEVPRRATHEDVARAVGLTAGTVGEHLRKVEGKVLSAVASR